MATLNKGIKASQHYDFGPWHIESEQSHILPSKCANTIPCTEVTENVKDSCQQPLCNFCRFENQLALPKLPDMTFADNYLKIEHSKGFGIHFNCFDSLREVENPRKPMKVAIADAWSESRDSAEQKEVIKPFDWTFYTKYKGTFVGEKALEVIPTTERIDMEKLKVKEEIKFYEDLCLFEDELADNGIAQLAVKMRVMDSGFFILLRYFLRVDNVVAKFHDTRIYHEAGNNYMLRECCIRENKLTEIEIPTAILINPPQLAERLRIKEVSTEILKFPNS